MADAQTLERTLRAIDRRGYKSYQSIRGDYDYPTFRLFIDHVQVDPFAGPSRIRARVDQRHAGFPPDLYRTPVRRIAICDAITRGVAAAIQRVTRGGRGSGRSGEMRVDVGDQEILERTSCVINDEFVETRISIGLPAAGRTVLGQEAAEMLIDDLPHIVDEALIASAYPAGHLDRFVESAEDNDALRAQLEDRGLVAFVADGAVLPRESGVSQRPLTGDNVVAFQSPPQLRVTLQSPNRGPVTGMGIPAGVTIIVGGGYHGKSTLLDALSRGVYAHIPGDGREYVVARAEAVKTRAEDGRRVENVDISPFIRELPFGRGTEKFSTDKASGSTSQATNIVEALEAGTSLLLMDEDTSATNFMVRDSRMQRLIPRDMEPITPLVDQIRNLYEQRGVSTVIVMGGSSDYFEVADTVIAMHEYEPRLVTDEAHALVEEFPGNRANESAGSFDAPRPRTPQPASVEPYRRGRVRVTARGLSIIQFGEETIDLSAVEQLVDPSQTSAIGDVLVLALQRGYFDGQRSVREALEQALSEIAVHGLDILSPYEGQHPGDYALPRLQELAAALNRLPSVEMRQRQ